MMAKSALAGVLVALSVPLVGLGVFSSLSGPFRAPVVEAWNRAVQGVSREPNAFGTASNLAICRQPLTFFNTSYGEPVQFITICPGMNPVTVRRIYQFAYRIELAHTPNQVHLHNAPNWRTLFHCRVQPTRIAAEDTIIRAANPDKFELLLVDYVVLELRSYDLTKRENRGRFNPERDPFC